RTGSDGSVAGGQRDSRPAVSSRDGMALPYGLRRLLLASAVLGAADAYAYRVREGRCHWPHQHVRQSRRLSWQSRHRLDEIPRRGRGCCPAIPCRKLSDRRGNYQLCEIGSGFHNYCQRVHHPQTHWNTMKPNTIISLCSLTKSTAGCLGLSLVCSCSAFADDLTPRPTMGEILRLD